VGSNHCGPPYLDVLGGGNRHGCGASNARRYFMKPRTICAI
jgi:hypothetical protein